LGVAYRFPPEIRPAFRASNPRTACAAREKRDEALRQFRERSSHGRQYRLSRARCEHPFRVIKHLWGFGKTRYRRIAKNLARAQTMFALANLYAVRHRLMPPGENVCFVTEKQTPQHFQCPQWVGEEP